jgi:hypothetical protein
MIGPGMAKNGFGIAHDLPVTPGNPDTFPWLHSIASCFEKYRFHRLRFEFVSSVPTTFFGSIMLMFDTDPQDPPPASYMAMAANRYTVSGQLWNNLTLDIKGIGKRDVDALDWGSYRYTDDREGGWFSRFNSVGKFIQASDAAGESNVGALWVDYDVELISPTLVASAEDNMVGVEATGESDVKSNLFTAVPVQTLIPGALKILEMEGRRVLEVPPRTTVEAVIQAVGTGIGTTLPAWRNQHGTDWTSYPFVNIVTPYFDKTWVNSTATEGVFPTLLRNENYYQNHYFYPDMSATSTTATGLNALFTAYPFRDLPIVNDTGFNSMA